MKELDTNADNTKEWHQILKKVRWRNTSSEMSFLGKIVLPDNKYHFVFVYDFVVLYLFVINYEFSAFVEPFCFEFGFKIRCFVRLDMCVDCASLTFNVNAQFYDYFYDLCTWVSGI